MAWTTPANWSVGESPTAAKFNTQVRDNLNYLHDSLPAAAVSSNAAQTIGTAAWTTLTFNIEHYDNATMHDNSTNNSRLTIPVSGCYELHAVVTFDAAASGALGGAFLLNGAGSHFGQVIVPASNLAGNGVHIFAMRSFTASNYIEARAYQSSGGDLGTYTIGAGTIGVLFSARWVGD